MRLFRHLLGITMLLGTIMFLSAPVSPASAVPPPRDWMPPKEAELSLPSAQLLDPVEILEQELEEQPEVLLVPEAPAVEEEYFSDAVFLGDSRTEGFHLYSGLNQGQYLHSVGATVATVAEKPTEKTAHGTVPILDALTEMSCGKVYLMLGINELGWPRPELFRDHYGAIIDRIRAEHPEAQVIIQSILPVSARQDAKKTYVNNQRIAVYNDLLRELSRDKQIPYLNVAEAVSDEEGCLRAEWTFDGVHLGVEGCRSWLNYLKTHPVQPE